MSGRLSRCVCLLVLAPACVFAHSRQDVERELQLVIGDEFPARGVSKVIERGPTVIPVLVEIVSGSREMALAWKGGLKEGARESYVARLAAIEALGFLLEGTDEAREIVPVLESVAGDVTDRGSFRSAAVRALALNGTEEGLDALERIFEQAQRSGDDLRLLIVGSFGFTPNDRGRAILAKIQAIDDPLIKNRVSSALKWKPEQRRLPKHRVKNIPPSPNCSALGESAGLTSPVLLLLLARVGVRRRILAMLGTQNQQATRLPDN